YAWRPELAVELEAAWSWSAQARETPNRRRRTGMPISSANQLPKQSEPVRVSRGRAKARPARRSAYGAARRSRLRDLVSPYSPTRDRTWSGFCPERPLGLHKRVSSCHRVQLRTRESLPYGPESV